MVNILVESKTELDNRYDAIQSSREHSSSCQLERYEVNLQIMAGSYATHYL